MIPKIIHYVWLGGGKKSPSVKRCIKSWRKVMPDYEIKEWNESNFDINSIPWVKEAISVGKWALASDCIRLWVLYKYGGIYMDTDVMVYKPFDEFLKYDFFTSVEFHPQGFIPGKDIDENGLPKPGVQRVAYLGLLSAAFAAVRNNPFIKDCLDHYLNSHFIRKDGSLDMDFIIPGVMAMVAVKYGFRFFDKTQNLDHNMIVFDSSVFASDKSTRNNASYSMHFTDHSWVKKTPIRRFKDLIRSTFPWYFKR